MNSPHEFLSLVAGLRAAETSGFSEALALVTLLRTWGSTFRRPGARMLVRGDGQTTRSLAGGCPERDLVERALRVIATGRAELARYDAGSIFDPMRETGCGGRIEVLIEPLGAQALRFVDALEGCLRSRRRGFVATVFARSGDCAPPLPLRLLHSDDDRLDQLGGGALSDAVAERGRWLAEPVSVETLEAEGARFEVLFECLRPPQQLVGIGTGAVARALSGVAVTLGWQTTLIDAAAPGESAPLPAGVHRLTALPEELPGKLRIDRETAVVAMTHHLARDVAWLNALAPFRPGYLGAIGSRARAARLRQATGLASGRLRAPAGLALGAETPEEIALAIAAEILATSRGA